MRIVVPGFLEQIEHLLQAMFAPRRAEDLGRAKTRSLSLVLPWFCLVLPRWFCPGFAHCYAWANAPDFADVAERTRALIESSYGKDRNIELYFKTLMETWRRIGEEFREAAIDRAAMRAARSRSSSEGEGESKGVSGQGNSVSIQRPQAEAPSSPDTSLSHDAPFIPVAVEALPSSPGPSHTVALAASAAVAALALAGGLIVIIGRNRN